MRIGQLTYSYQPIIGGADAYADLLCSTLRARGHEVLVYQRAAPTEDPFVRRAPAWPSDLFGARDFWLVPWWLRTQRPALSRLDVLIGHYPNYCAAAYWHRRLIGLSHGVTWDDSPASWRARQKKRMAQEAFARCARFVANDTFFLREMGLDLAPGERAFEEVAPGRWFIPNCVDTAVFTPVGRSAGDRARAIIVPRNFYRNRGVDLAVAALGLVAAEFPDVGLRLVGAESQADYALEVRALVTSLGLEERVRFTGSVAWRDMPAAYAEADVCLVPSRCGEGTSLAALEAMACGVATITTTAGGLPDLPAVHAEATPTALAQALREVLPRAAETGRAQCDDVRARFALARWRTAWAQVVEDW